MFIEVWHVRVDEARDRLQTKTTHYNKIFSSLIYINIIKLSFRIKKGFCVLVGQFIIWVSNKDKKIDELDIKIPGEKKYRKDFLRLNNYFVKISLIEQEENCTKTV